MYIHETYSFIILARTHMCMSACQYILTCTYGCVREFWMSVFTWLRLPFASVWSQSLSMVITTTANLTLSLSLNYPPLIYNCTPKRCGRLKSRPTWLLIDEVKFTFETSIYYQDSTSTTNWKRGRCHEQYMHVSAFCENGFFPYKLCIHVFSSYIFFNM